MSFQTFCGKDPNDPTTYQKVLKEFLDDTATAVPALNAVLGVGNSASNQSMTDIDDIGCVSIETSKVYAGNFAFVELGEAGDDIKLLGATAKGSIVVGDGVLTQSLPVGANGLVLTANSGAALGVEWAAGGGGGGVASVSAGTNISVSGTASNPIVNIQSPLTSTLDIGGQTISSTLTAGNINFDNGITKTNINSGMTRLQDSTNVAINTTITRSLVAITDPALGMTQLTADTLSQLGLTSALNINPSAGNDLNMNVSGAGRVHIIQGGTGGDTQPAISVENNNGNANGVHLDLYKNSSSPAAADALGGVSFHGNSSTGVKTEYASIDATIADPTNASQNGSLALSCCVNSATPTTFLTCNGLGGTIDLSRSVETQGNQIRNTTAGQSLTLLQTATGGAITLQNNGANGAVNITSGSGGSVSINGLLNTNIVASVGDIGLTAGNGSIKVAQSQGARTQLRTTITPTISTQPVEFYPEVSVDNNNSNSLNIEAPKVFYQKLNLLNTGINPLSTWVDVGNANGNCDSMFLASGGYVWLGIGSQIIITETTFSTIFQTINLGGGTTIRANCFWEDSGYVFVGGCFDSVNGNATQQYGLTRIYLGGGAGLYVEDPMYDTTNNIYGCGSGQEVYALTATAGILYVGGNFTTFSNGTGIGYGFQVLSYTGSGGSQTYDTGTSAFVFNGEVKALTTNGTYVFWGGNFTTANAGGQSVNYMGAWNGGWTQVASNSLSGSVFSLAVSQSVSGYILVGGTFSTGSSTNLTYIDGSNPNSELYPNIAPSSIDRNCIYASGGQDYFSTNSGDNYKTTGSLTWEHLGQSNAGVAPSSIFFYSGSVYNSYYSYGYVRRDTIQAQNITYVGFTPNTFLYNGANYTNFHLATRYSAQSFIADRTGNYWLPLGQICLGGSFS